jgi:phosphomevalonate kinase
MRRWAVKIQVEVPGKLILLGEYAVLEGADALVMAVDRRMQIGIEPATAADSCTIISNLQDDPFHFYLDRQGRVRPLKGQADELAGKMHFACQAISALLRRISDFNLPLEPFILQIDSRQFYMNQHQKLGLGSSAALTVGIVIALLRHFRLQKELFPTAADLFKFCLPVHYQAQNRRGSGIDVAASVYGGIVHYNLVRASGDAAANFRIDHALINGLTMRAVWTGQSASTGKLLQTLEKFQAASPAVYVQIMQQLTLASARGCQAFTLADPVKFMTAVADYFKILSDFSQRSGIAVVSEVHQKIAGTVQSCAGVYKPSGAGQGDLGIAFFDSAAAAEKAETELKKKHFATLQLDVSQQGGFSLLSE